VKNYQSGKLCNLYFTRLPDFLASFCADLRNYQNQLMGQATTDGDGFAKIPVSYKPFLLVASKDKQRGYLRLDDASSLSLSMFDVGGQDYQKGVKGYIYGERGVWRPGDSIYVTFILEDKNRLLPENHPVVFELYNPQNQLFQRKVKTVGINGFYDFRTATNNGSPTGKWLVKVKVGGSVFSQYLKIETIKPNRLKINLDFKKEILTTNGPQTGDLTVKWLHGAIAKNLKTDVAVTLDKGSTSFGTCPGYQFDDVVKTFGPQEQTIFDGQLDEAGKAAVSANFTVNKNAPGMLSAKFKIRAFEEGGEYSTDIMTMKVSPYSEYVGLKIPEGKGWNGALYSNEPNLIPIVTVDNKGKPVNAIGLKIEVN
jgi:alpha-2-macroglobulin